MKIITLCGSMKYKKEMMELAIELQLKGNIVLTPAYPVDENKNYSLDEMEMLSKVHKEKINLSDTIFVVNVNNYIGKSTKSEIEYAQSLNKEIMYYEGE
ncbi:MAG: hypothetical protein IJH39_12410 [Clostridia bacterium]|nr:hypothetical protein [Clostridia bacterium]